MTFCIHSLTAAVSLGECTHGEINVPFLVGNKSQAAFAHISYKKMQFIDYITAANRAHTDISDMKTICAEVRENVLPHFISPKEMMAKLRLHGGKAAPDVPDTSGIPSSGIAAKTMTSYPDYRKSLVTPAAACLADVLHGVLTDQYNEEFLALAQNELSTTTHNTCFADYLAKREDEKDGGDESPLQQAYGEYVKSCYAKPTAVPNNSGVVDEELHLWTLLAPPSTKTSSRNENIYGGLFARNKDSSSISVLLREMRQRSRT